MSGTSSLSQPNIRFRHAPTQNELASTQEWQTKTVRHWQLELYQTDEGYLIRNLAPSSEPHSASVQPLTFLPHGGIIELPQSNIHLAIIGLDGQLTSKDVPSETPLSQTPSGVYFDTNRCQFFIDHQRILPTVFTALEHDLLKYLYDHMGIVCTYYRIGNAVWKGWVQKGTIVKTVSNLRKKLNQVCPGAGSRYLRTSRGYQPGYTLVGASQ